MSGFKAWRWIWFGGALVLLGFGLHVALQVVPADADQGNVGRILYYHVPTWVAMSICLLTNLVASLAYLGWRHRNVERSLQADALAVSSAEMGVVFCFLGNMTGSLWGRAVWGIWWTWDARLTTTLILLLIYVSYLLLRRFAEGAQMRTLAAVLAIFAFCDIPIVYMSTRWWRTQHPGPVFFGGPNAGMAASMRPAVDWNIAAWLVWGLLMVSLRYSVERRQQKVQQAAGIQALEAHA